MVSKNSISPIWIQNNNFSIFPLRQRLKVLTIFRGFLVIRYKSGDKKTVRSRVEYSAVDYWAVHVGEAWRYL